MRLSAFFVPTAKEAPAEAAIISHQLMLRAGMIHQESAGIYSWLPLGCRVLHKVAAIVRAEQDAAGFNEMLMPTIQPADIWRESGRYDAYGPEMLRIRDRHDREMLYGPTNEEMITAIARSYLTSYRDLPVRLYHIQWKFRDEIRPRFGVMRGREFLMKDAYSFDVDTQSARLVYDQVFASYLRIFARLGLKAVAVRADTGPIGGDMSHEFHVLAATGESTLYYDAAYDDLLLEGSQVDVQALQSLYAADADLHDPSSCPVAPERLRQARGIEIGHIFHFGDKYSAPMKVQLQGTDDRLITPQMGSYGIGISRLPAAIIEASHDDAGIIWPPSVAPFRVGLIDLKPADDQCSAVVADMKAKLERAGLDTLHDDRDIRAGAKFADMDLIGLPWQVTIGPRGLQKGLVEVKNRADGERQELSVDAALNFLVSA